MGTGHSTFEPEFKLFATGWLVWLDGPIARNQNIENGALKKGCNPFSFGSLKFDSCEVAGASYPEQAMRRTSLSAETDMRNRHGRVTCGLSERQSSAASRL